MSEDREPERHAETLVLGIGNTLLRDEGAGIIVVQALREAERARPGDAIPGVLLMDGGTHSFSLLEPIIDCAALIVIDAADMGQPAGAVRLFENEVMDRFLASPGRKSVHEVSLLDLLGMAALMGRLPARRALIGIQPGWIDWGDTLSTAVAAAIEHAARLARSTAQAWQVMA